jgi:hypothetical protein
MLFALLFLSPAAHADIQPGEWEMTVTSQMEGMPQPIGPLVKKQCLTAEDARDPTRVVNPATGSCEFSNRRDSGSFYPFDVVCGGQYAMRGSGSMRVRVPTFLPPTRSLYAVALLYNPAPWPGV